MPTSTLVKSEIRYDLLFFRGNRPIDLQFSPNVLLVQFNMLIYFLVGSHFPVFFFFSLSPRIQTGSFPDEATSPPSASDVRPKARCLTCPFFPVRKG